MNMHFFKNLFLYSRPWLRQTKYIPVVIMTKKGATKIVNFIIPGAGVLVQGRGYISFIVKMHYFFKILFTISRHRSDKLMMSEEVSTKIENFMTPRAGILVQGCGHISCIVKMNYFFKNLHLFTPS